MHGLAGEFWNRVYFAWVSTAVLPNITDMAVLLSFRSQSIRWRLDMVAHWPRWMLGEILRVVRRSIVRRTESPDTSAAIPSSTKWNTIPRTIDLGSNWYTVGVEPACCG